MWEITSAAADSDELACRMREGWEPFTVTLHDQVRGDNRQKVPVVWLRRFPGTPKPITVRT